MRSTLLVLPAFAASAMAGEATRVFVTWRHELASGSTSLTIQGSDKAVLAESCGSTIGSLDFSKVDEHGGGSISVGDKEWEVLTYEKDEGPVCNRIYNGDIAVVECTGLEVEVPENSAKSADCFKHEQSKRAFHGLTTRSEDIKHAAQPAQSPNMPAFHSRILDRRQTTCISNQDISPVDGPEKATDEYKHKQISETIDCASAPSCSVGKIETESFTIGFSTEVIPFFGSFFKDKWTKAGLNVQKSWITGNTYTCNGAKGDKVCIWYKTHHKKYKVRGTSTSSCYQKNNGKAVEWYLLSPVDKNEGGGYYCVLGTCRSKGEEYWGGP